MSSHEPESEWTPPYLLDARTHASEILRHEPAGSEAAVLAAAVRELTAEIRAFRHQIAGGNQPENGGALGDLGEIIYGLPRRLGG